MLRAVIHAADEQPLSMGTQFLFVVPVQTRLRFLVRSSGPVTLDGALSLFRSQSTETPRGILRGISNEHTLSKQGCAVSVGPCPLMP